jgi:hypothetical protein
MSHQDRKSKERIVVNHESLKQAVNRLFTAKAFRGMKARTDAKWTPRMLAVVALFWAWSGVTILTGRFEEAARVVRKIFRWLPSPGKTYQGFVKQLGKCPGVRPDGLSLAGRGGQEENAAAGLACGVGA